jgi:hypothetical protein
VCASEIILNTCTETLLETSKYDHTVHTIAETVAWVLKILVLVL